MIILELHKLFVKKNDILRFLLLICELRDSLKFLKNKAEPTSGFRIVSISAPPVTPRLHRRLLASPIFDSYSSPSDFCSPETLKGINLNNRG